MQSCTTEGKVASVEVCSGGFEDLQVNALFYKGASLLNTITSRFRLLSGGAEA